TKYIESIVGKDVPVIRAMPNMAAIIGESISSISPGSSVTSDDMKLAKEIFMTIGDVVEIDEKSIDGVTAISGSGPAYFFYMIEALIDAGSAAGLERDVAKRLVLKTALGSAKLLEILKEDPSAMRAKVTSKGGTTQAAMDVFEDRKFKDIIKDAVKAAIARSKELSKVTVQ
ncbi:MAG: pyrroline-5-carboxylate reductase dimerization domain-containing protein, partial [Candidatus Omnitrophota bacterium]|nr:pyrroline-5-carboxylate reductase dimerization domain-containing protein [Candidatus Omnitrophota bacterium]